MRIFRQLPLADGDVAAYHEINANQQAVAGEINGGIDRENVTQHGLTRAKLEGSQTGYHFVSTATTTQMVPTGEWTRVTIGGVFTLTGPVLVILHGSMVADENASQYLNYAVGFKVNGNLIGDSGFEQFATVDAGFAKMTKSVQCAAWVPDKTIDCEFVYRVPQYSSYTFQFLSTEVAAIIRRR